MSRNADKIPIFYYLCGCICFNRIYGTLVIHNFQRLSHRSAHFGAYGSYRYFVYSAHSQQRALVGVLYRFGGFFLRYVLLYAHRFGHVDFIKTNQNILQIIGSLVLVGYGIYLIRKNPAGSLRPPEEKKNTYTQDTITGFLFCFSNPLILFLTIGLFTRFNFIQQDMPLFVSLIGYLFIFGGAMLWWFLITFFVNAVRTHFNLRSMWLVNTTIGVIILIMSAVGLIMGVKDYFLNING